MQVLLLLLSKRYYGVLRQDHESLPLPAPNLSQRILIHPLAYRHRRLAHPAVACSPIRLFFLPPYIHKYIHTLSHGAKATA